MRARLRTAARVARPATQSVRRLGFARDDLAAFGVTEAAARAEALGQRVVPLLAGTASALLPGACDCAGPLRLRAPEVSADEVAAVLEPPDAGVRYALTMSRAGVHLRLQIASAARSRPERARALARAAAALARDLSRADLRRYDDWSGAGLPAPGSPGEPGFWRDVAARLAAPDGRLDLGTAWPETRAVLLCQADLVAALRVLAGLHRRLAC